MGSPCIVLGRKPREIVKREELRKMFLTTPKYRCKKRSLGGQSKRKWDE